MEAKGRTLAARIEALARRTGASPTYVEKVRALFLRKGIPLDSDAAPYSLALEEAFTRQETIRRSVNQAMENLVQLRNQLGLLEQTREKYIARLREIQSSLQRQSRVVQGRTRQFRETPASNSEHGTLVPGERDFSIVPGPDGLH